VAALLTAVLVVRIAQAETPATSSASPKDASIPRLVPAQDYRGDLWDRSTLTGDWGGTRQDLADRGIVLDSSYTNIFQKTVGGGLSDACTYRGGLDLTLSIDTNYAGWWPGGVIKVKGEGGWGDGNSRRTGALMPVDANGLYPIPGEDVVTLAELNYTQFLSPQFGVTLGKYEPRDTNVFAHDPTSQFLNAAYNFNPVMGPTVPLNFLGAGVIVIPVDGLILTVLALDTEGSAGRAGFDTVFEGGTSVLSTAELKVTPFGLTGHQRISFQWSDKLRSQLDQSPRLIIEAIRTGSTAGLATRSTDWSFTYDFDQFIYQVPGSEDRGIGIFGRYGYSDGAVNPVSGFYSIGVLGQGLIPGRPHDSFGAAYYYLQVSGDLPDLVERRISDEHGAEFFYNLAVTQWMQVSPDVQVVDSVRNNVDLIVVVGLRAKFVF
jgi:porin